MTRDELAATARRDTESVGVVSIEVAEVYRFGNTRYLTLRAAMKNRARAILRTASADYPAHERSLMSRSTDYGDYEPENECGCEDCVDTLHGVVRGGGSRRFALVRRLMREWRGGSNRER